MSFKPIQPPDDEKEVVQPTEAPSKNEQEHGAKKAAKYNKRQIIETELSYLYEFRRNMLTKIPEFRKVNMDNDWTRMTDDALFSIERQMQLAGLSFASDALLKKVIKSDYAPAYHPIKSYFQQLDSWDGQNHIKELAATVETTVPSETFEKYLCKWLVGVVANVWIENKCANHLCFVLAGGQGAFKSTWIKHLMPPSLEAYCYDGPIDPESKDSLIRASENMIINMDDYFADISGSKVNTLKGFITLDVVKIRRPYASFDEIMPKICSFIGSSNEIQFLFDGTGSRRFLPFLVKSIDINKAKSINIDKVYAQAYHLFQNKFVYWIEKREQAALEEQNDMFKIQTMEYELVFKHLEVPEDIENPMQRWTTTEIRNYLQGYSKDRVGIKKLGSALKLIGFQRKKKTLKGNSVYMYPLNLKVTKEEEFKPKPIE